MLGVLLDKKALFCRLQIKVCPKGLHSFAFYILIFAFSLTRYASRFTLHLCPRYASRDARAKTTYYAKRTQIQKSPNERKCCFNKGLWKLDTWLTWEKRTQNEPKRSQMQKSQNEHKYCFNKGLQRKMNNEGLRKTNPNKAKTNPNKANFKPVRKLDALMRRLSCPFCPHPPIPANKNHDS